MHKIARTNTYSVADGVAILEHVKTKNLNLTKDVCKSADPQKKLEVMSDHEMQKLEELLNCKNRAINKWIQEKEDEFDELTQKIYKKGKKLIEGKTLTEEIDEQIRIQEKVDNRKLNRESGSKRSSIRITETESEGR